MHIVGRDTDEYKILDKHFQSSISVTLSNGAVKSKETPGKVWVTLQSRNCM